MTKLHSAFEDMIVRANSWTPLQLMQELRDEAYRFQFPAEYWHMRESFYTAFIQHLPGILPVLDRHSQFLGLKIRVFPDHTLPFAVACVQETRR